MTNYNLTFDPTGWVQIDFIEVDGETSTTIQSTSYHPTQLDLIQADCTKHGVTLSAEDSQAVADWVAAYVPPPSEPVQVPQVLTMRQARLVLHQVGLLDDVEAAVAAAHRAVQIEWEYAQEVQRTWPTLIALAGAMNLNDAALDALFMTGATL